PRHERREADGHVYLVEAPACPLEADAEVRHHDVSDVLERVEVTDHPVGDLTGELDHLRPVGGDVDSRRPFRELHLELEVADGKDLPLVADAVTAQKA